MKRSIFAVLSVVIVMSISTNYAFAAVTTVTETLSVINAGVTQDGIVKLGVTGDIICTTFGSVWFIDINTKSMALSIGMAALLSGKRVSVDVVFDSTNKMCWGYGIYILK